MRLSASWVLWMGLSFVACGDDDQGQSEGAVEASDASTDQEQKPDDEKKSSKSAEKAGSGSGGAGGSKSMASSASGEKKPASDSKGDDEKSDAPKDGDSSEGDESKESSADQPASPDSSGSPEPDMSKTDEGDKSAESAPPATGDQLSVCSMIEGDCNQGLACHAPAGPFAPGRGYCSKICEQDADCAGVAPEGTRYTCSTGPGTHTCELACSGAEDSSCPSAMACVQTGVRRRPVATPDGGAPEGEGTTDGDAGAARPSAVEPLFHCRHPFAVSKIWEPCGDATHVCGEGLRCASTFWFGGAGHCTRSCEADGDCAKPESGTAQPSCLTLVPAFGETPAVKQCVLSCSGAKDGCPNGLSCFEGPEVRSGMDTEPTPAFAFCQ